MKARRKSDGKIIEVETYMLNSRRDKNGLWESSYKDINSGLVYEAFGLDFNLDAEETVISGWMARDGNGNLLAYTHKPIRSDKPYWLGEAADFILPNDVLPDLTWKSEPQECEIIIKRKKK